MGDFGAREGRAILGTMPGDRTRLVLHVGVQKTASSYIQQRLEDARPELLAQGVLVPRLFNEAAAHHNLARLLREEPLLHRTRRSFQTMTPERRIEVLASSQAPTLLLSSEMFPTLTRAQLAGFGEAMAPRRPTVVVYLRRRSDFVLSKWRSEVAAMERPPLFTYVDQMINDRWNRRLPAYVALLRRLDHAFGRDAIRIVHYDGMVAADVDATDALLEAADLDVTVPAHGRGSRVNVSASVLECEVMRLVHAHRGTPMAARRSIKSEVRRLHDDAHPAWVEAAAAVEAGVTGHDTLEAVDEHYAEEDEKLLADFGDAVLYRPSTDRLFPVDNGYRKIPVFGGDPTTDKELRHAVERLSKEVGG